MVTHTELVVTSTGELLTAIDTDRPTGLQIRQWVKSIVSAVQHMATVDEVDQADVLLAGMDKRLKQLGEDASEVQRARVYVLKRRGELLPPPVRGNPQRTNQYTAPAMSQHEDIAKKPKQQRQLDWQAHKVVEHWDAVEPLLAKMKKPSPNAVMREIKRITSKLSNTPDGGEACITLSRWEDWLPRQPDCDLLLTDPPYATDIDDIGAFAAGWLPVALAKVKSTGRAYVCVGAYPHELAAYLTIPPPPHLVLSQLLVWTYRNTLGPTPKHDYKLNWQAILYYRGVDAGPLDAPEMLEQFSVQDINAPDGRQGDRWHAWQKPDKLAERFVRHATEPGDLILDPFAGTGTHLLAAAKLGRRGYGCDASPETFEIARQRGCADAI